MFDPLGWARDLCRVARVHRAAHGAYPNLLFPKTFNEKIARRKLFDRRPIYHTVCDKLATKAHVEALLGPGYTPSTLAVYDRPEDFRAADVTRKCVLKSTAGWNDVVVLEPGAVDEEDARRRIGRMLHARHGDKFVEWGYRGVRNRAFTEEFIGPGGTPDDYKLFCFHGRVEYARIFRDRFGEGKAIRTVDRGMRPLPFNHSGPAGWAAEASAEEFARMVEVAETLSAGWDFLRVDLYLTEGRVWVGELTAYPGAGRLGFDPPEWDRAVGDLW